MDHKPLVSYVIGVRNMQDTIGLAIESILKQDYPNKEIVVINDGSDDNTEEVLKKYPVKFINTKKIGISNARNLGYKNSNGDFIAFTDADCELDISWTKNILKEFKEENVGLVGGMTLFKTDSYFSSKYRSTEFKRRFNNIKKSEVVWSGGPGSIFRKDVLDEIGGFNPQWFHGEDAEISFLTIEHGYKVHYRNDAITYHVPESGFLRLVRKGFRDAKAHIRVVKSHTKTSLRNKFNMMWYFPYDMVLLPCLYAFLIISGIFLPLLYLFNFYFSKSLSISDLVQFVLSIWIFLISLIAIFLIIYSFFPSFEVILNFKDKRFSSFIGTFILHHIRGFAWGLGLLFGIKNIIINKK